MLARAWSYLTQPAKFNTAFLSAFGQLSIQRFEDSNPIFRRGAASYSAAAGRAFSAPGLFQSCRSQSATSRSASGDS